MSLFSSIRNKVTWSNTKGFINSSLSYSTVKLIRIRDARLGCIHLLIQLTVILYVIFFALVYKQEYLERETAKGTVVVKIKGVSRGEQLGGKKQIQTFDAYDLVYPATELNGLFLATKMSETKGQKRGWCVPETKTACERDVDCSNVVYDKEGHSSYISGKPGRCNSKSLCEYNIWCPDEEELNDAQEGTVSTLMLDVANFTVWFKASIAFPLLGGNKVYSTIKEPKPRWHSDHPHSGNLFRISEVLEIANQADNRSNTTYDSVRDRGCIIRVTTNWHCNLDKSDTTKACSIKYDMLRLDSEEVGDGFNFRKTNYFTENGTEYRDLDKMYGIRLILESKGVGYKVSVVQIILQLSSGLAMMTISSTICDLLLQYVLPQKNTYKKFKVSTKSIQNETRAEEEDVLMNDDTDYYTYENA